MCNWADTLLESYKKYVGKNNWVSYFYQIDEIIYFAPNSVLEIGTGMGILRAILKNVLDINIDSIDINETLKPDFIGSVVSLPFPDKSYEVVCCFQVLEHLPFEDFEKGLSELFRVAEKAVIISLPNARKLFRIHISIRNINLVIKSFFLKKKSTNHFWEINLKGYAEKKIKQKINEIALQYGFLMKKNYRVFDIPFHHFFVLEKKNNV
ncbi:MAG: class I SAM-dependent methyltransferase [Candidatus Cloacimonetes bacterium]|nr:class I SAM-dependent methyltransferase [Candidatus Cloacimonadota bacterium]